MNRIWTGDDDHDHRSSPGGRARFRRARAGEGTDVLSSPYREHRASQAFVALADTLVDDYDVVDLLDQLSEYCVNLLPADAAGILLGDTRRELRAVAASSQDAATLELLQIQSGQGPCLDCFDTVAPVLVPDLTTSRSVAARWPVFVDAVVRAGAYRSVHALPLRLRGQAIGALNLFCTRPGPLPEHDLELGQALADVATIGILSERAVRHGEIVTEQLQTALNGRIVIEQAKGVIAHTLQIGTDMAFERLRSHCRHHNLRLVETARQITIGAFNTHVLERTP